MRLKKVIFIALFAYCGASTAETVQIECPKNIEVTESAQGIDGTWAVEKDLGKRGKFLDSISVYSGHPKNMGNLVPDKTTQKNSRRKYVWIFSGHEEDLWIACTYTNSTLLLTKILPKNTKTCELSEKILPTGAKLTIESMVCE